MDEINKLLSMNLKKMREQEKISLDTLSRMTGVSKSMLGQIERGEGNPTVATVWKISNGLKIPFTELVSKPHSEREVIKKGSVSPLYADEEKYRAYPVFPYDHNRKFEIYYIELDPGAVLDAEAHHNGAQEFITVFSGSIKISVSGDEFVADTGDAVRFKADVPHSYYSVGKETCRVSMTICYEK